MPTMEKGDRSATSPWARSSRSAAASHLKRATASSCPSRFPAGLLLLSEGSLLLLRHDEPQRGDGRRRWVIRRPGSLGSPTCWAATPAARPNTCACHSPTWARSRFRTGFPTSRCCSCPTSFRPATWRRRTAASSRAIRSRSGAAGRSASSPSRAPGCSAPAG